MEAVIPIPALSPALRGLEGACALLVDSGEFGAVMVGGLAEDDVVELDAACLVRDCGEGA